MNYLKDKFKENCREIIIDDVKNLPEIDFLADNTIVKIKEKNLNVTQFSFKKEQEIPLEEQLKWFLSNLTEQPIENYVWHYSLFNSDDQSELMGLICYFDQQDFAKILTKYQQQNLSLIVSEDEQFVFYKNKIYFWQKKVLLKKIAPFVVSINVFLLVVFLSINLVISFKTKAILAKKNLVQEKLTELESLFTLIQAGQVRAKQELFNKKENERNCDLLVNLTSKIPKELYFNELVFNEEDIKVSGCDRSSLTGVNFFIKDLKKIKDIQDISLLKTAKNNQGMNFDLQIVLKNRKTADNKKGAEKNV